MAKQNGRTVLEVQGQQLCIRMRRRSLQGSIVLGKENCVRVVGPAGELMPVQS